MSRASEIQMRPICAEGTGRCGDGAPSDNDEPAGSDEVPDFVSRAIALGYEPEATWALYRRLIRTTADVRARRLTPAGGLRRAERLALAVSIAKAAGVSR